MLAGIKLKEELKQLLWGVETLTLPRLDKPNALRLAEKVCLAFGSRASAKDVAAASQGIPGKIVSFAAAGEVANLIVAERHLAAVLLLPNVESTTSTLPPTR